VRTQRPALLGNFADYVIDEQMTGRKERPSYCLWRRSRL